MSLINGEPEDAFLIGKERTPDEKIGAIATFFIFLKVQKALRLQDSMVLIHSKLSELSWFWYYGDGCGLFSRRDYSHYHYDLCCRVSFLCLLYDVFLNLDPNLNLIHFD